MITKLRTKVSVLLLTFNHEKWVSRSIESVLSQKTDFDYELVIIEDCSTDSTRDIVTEFQQRYPERIKLILSEKNGEYRTNFATAFLASPSQYIARLDGDDYWTSPHKLQKLVDFLDTHPECALCFHNVRVFYEDEARRPWLHNPSGQEEITTLEDLLLENFIAGCSPLLRNGLFSEFPDWFYAGLWLDWPLYILSAQHGKIGYIDDVMGAWRIHSQGMWSSLDELQQLEQLMKFYVSLNANLNSEYEDIIRCAVSNHCNYYARECSRQLDASRKRLKKLRSSLQKERQRCELLGIRNRDLTLRLQSFETRRRSIQGSRIRKLATSVNHIKGKLLGG